VTPFLLASLTYVLMVLAFYWHRMRRFHVPVMVFIILFDLAMPFYLVATRDWKTRLLDHGDILSFGVWMHFGLLIALFVLYALQIHTALRLLRRTRDDEEMQTARREHGAQGKGILLVRALVITSGALLAEPQEPD
jgi:hypothetical protein